ncbi:NAD(P)H-dependent oxidoreductase [Novosphingobium album (ex Liu et al. 2023)]|uniref:NAD(P)H-dependent oxidoreductase n=1 Tax=Novosphingobium album (ex Liu et al. 2023) TaxID=3031130 RepID=A0ABT5WXP3_9SPHN|nr:NAD(P)H-dependent oxidoreductase [Novosphingobium album (ex Liu et al. 2023)]MDE8654680.1 NAD(P)H-dependent oxidoreductase [Novosphingobium album (ex Liu et al. 2023)]
MTRITMIDGHPDPDPARFVHGLGDAYAAGAEAGVHEVRRIDIGALDFPILRSEKEWHETEPVAAIRHAQTDIRWADHLVILYPLWLGDMPALLKAFLEQVLRPGFAIDEAAAGAQAKLLTGRSARIIVTMGMPAPLYRFFYRAPSLRSLRRNLLNFVGVRPVRASIIGSVERSAERRQKWLQEVRLLGEAAR